MSTALSELEPVTPPATHLPEIAIEEVSRETSRAIERAEVAAWLDLYKAAPADFAARQGLSIASEGDLIWTTCRTIPFIHFNCVKNIGVDGPATEGQVDVLLARYRDAGVMRPWFYTNPHAEPTRLRCWLEARGLQHQGGWERIYRDATPLPDEPLFPGDPLIPVDDLVIEEVRPRTASEWASFIDANYRLPRRPGSPRLSAARAGVITCLNAGAPSSPYARSSSQKARRGAVSTPRCRASWRRASILMPCLAKGWFATASPPAQNSSSPTSRRRAPTAMGRPIAITTGLASSSPICAIITATCPRIRADPRLLVLAQFPA
ncbi:hypothetical protein ACVOMV_38055 [Mesorhizobium atlanticum]